MKRKVKQKKKKKCTQTDKESKREIHTQTNAIELNRKATAGYYARAFIKLNLWVNWKHGMPLGSDNRWNLWQCQTINCTHNVVNFIFREVTCRMCKHERTFVPCCLAQWNCSKQIKSKCVHGGNSIWNGGKQLCRQSIFVGYGCIERIHLQLKLDVPQTFPHGYRTRTHTHTHKFI